MKFILGKKVKMSQVFDEEGAAVPVTLVEAGPCFVTQIKKKEKDGYNAVQVGFERKKKNIKKTEKGKEFRYLREFRTSGDFSLPKENKEGEKKITAGLFEKGDKVRVSAVSKGKGFAGGVKRHGFVDKAKAHGAKDMRRIGSTGCRFPQRTIKGKRMPGRTGSRRVTVKNLEVVEVDPENDILALKGAVPGHRGSLVEIATL